MNLHQTLYIFRGIAKHQFPIQVKPTINVGINFVFIGNFLHFGDFRKIQIQANALFLYVFCLFLLHRQLGFD